MSSDAPVDTTAQPSKQMKTLEVLQSGRPVDGYKNTPELIQKHKELTNDQLYFRFPPEPNGFLHIGHAKSMNLNFGNAKHFDGKCYLRYDDTNPESEEQLYIDAIKEMAMWMGWRPDWVTYSSDYFDQLYDFAITLIKKEKAYVCHSTAEEMKKQREEMTESPWRNRSVEDNLKHFEWMRSGRYGESEATLRLKMDMKSVNPNLRDVVAYRTKFVAHPHVGSKWCIYPSYDYTHCLVDSLEQIDYSLCTLEFETRRESYFWLLKELDIWRPNVWEFSRLNVTGALLSKRKINVLVSEKIVRGFDDPRLLTLAGMRRRGYTPKAINNFCELVGITRTQNVIQSAMLENSLREDLDERSPRVLAVIDPIKLVIDNWKGQQTVDCPNHPRDESRGTRKASFSDTLWIDRSDFREEDDSKFYGIAPTPGKAVGLKYSGNVLFKEFKRDPKTNEVTEIHVDIDFDRAVKPKTNISWVDAKAAAPVEFRLYDPLLTDDKAAIDPDFLQYINAESEHVKHGYAESSVTPMSTYDNMQIERFGYFCIDCDTKKDKIVMNRIISLREDKAKVAAPAPKKSNKTPKTAKAPKEAKPAAAEEKK